MVVNDPGGSSKGEGADKRPADEVVEIINDRGGEAIASYDDVGDWTERRASSSRPIDAFGALDIIVNNAGILRDALDRQDDRGRLRLGDPACTSRARST